MKYSKYILILFAAFTLNVYATKVAPTAQGAYYSGVKAYGYTVTFTGSGSHDNDDQTGGSTPQYQWDFDYVGTTFTVDASTTNTLVTHAYNAPGTYRVGVKYMDNDGQWSQPYPFTITIREVRRVFYVKDHLGNIRQSLNESGTVVAAQDYYPYGEFISGRSYNSGHPLEKYRFTEKERDIETGYDYFGGRLYDGALGIWGQADPIGEKYTGWSLYNYTLNNPLRFIDPHGLSPESVLELQDRYEQMMERERQRHGGSYNPENGGGDDGWGSMLLDLLGLKTAGPKYETKSEEDVEEEIIVNQGITDQEKANIQFATCETYVSLNMKIHIVAPGILLGIAALPIEGMATATSLTTESLLLGIGALIPTYSIDYLNYIQTQNFDFTASSLSTVTTVGGFAGSLLKMGKTSTGFGAIGLGYGIFSLKDSFEHEKQTIQRAWNPKNGF